MTEQVPPSDLGQAKVRIAFSIVVFLWSVSSTEPAEYTIRGHQATEVLASIYLLTAIVLYIGSPNSVNSTLRLVRGLSRRRYLCLCLDGISMVSYAIVGAANCVIVLPFMVTYVVGYGFRFGSNYFYASALIVFVGTVLTVQLNAYVSDRLEVATLFVIATVLIPVYAYELLRMYRNLLDQIESRRRELDFFVTSISHEIRSPLSALLGFLESAKSPSSEDDEISNTQGILQDAGQCADHLLELSNRLVRQVSVSRGPDLEKQCFVLGETKRIIDYYQLLAHKKGLNFHWHVSLDVPIVVDIDSSTYQDIVRNLIDNAVKYTPAGEVVVNISIEVVKDVDWLVISVSDTGPGLQGSQPPIGTGSHKLQNGPTLSAGVGLQLTERQLKNLNGKLTHSRVQPVGLCTRASFPVNGLEREDHILGIFTVLVYGSSDAVPIILDAAAKAGIVAVCDDSFRSAIRLVDTGLYEAFILNESLNPAQVTELAEFLQRRRKKPVLVDTTGVSPAFFPDGYAECVNQTFPAANESTFCRVRELLRYESNEWADVRVSQEFGNRTVLIVDDSLLNAEMLSRKLEKYTRNILVAGSIGGAKNVLKSESVDVLVTDLHIGDGSGLELPQYCKAEIARQPITVVVSGDDSEQARFNAFTAGALAYLKKPVNVAELIKIACAEVGVQSTAIEDLVADLTREQVNDLLSKFRSESAISISKIARLLADPDLEAVHRELHKLHGLIAMTGASDVSDSIRSLNETVHYFVEEPQKLLVQLVRLCIECEQSIENTYGKLAST